MGGLCEGSSRATVDLRGRGARSTSCCGRVQGWPVARAAPPPAGAAPPVGERSGAPDIQVRIAQGVNIGMEGGASLFQ